MFISRVEINPYRRNTRKAMDSPQIMHASIMASFPAIFESSNQRVLWRIDKYGPATYLLVQSENKPDFSHIIDQYGWPESNQKWDVLDYEKFLSKIDNGSVWRFKLVANPVYSVKQEGMKRGKIMAHVTVKQQLDWLIERSSKWGFSIVLVDGCNQLNVMERSIKQFERNGKKITISVVTFEGALKVIERDLFIECVKSGFGREKAYGCGLMTVMR